MLCFAAVGSGKFQASEYEVKAGRGKIYNQRTGVCKNYTPRRIQKGKIQKVLLNMIGNFKRRPLFHLVLFKLRSL